MSKLTAGQAKVLEHIYHHNSVCHTNTLRKLSPDNKLNIPLLRELCRSGYLEFRDEGRSKLWQITDAGRDALAEYRDVNAIGIVDEDGMVTPFPAKNFDNIDMEFAEWMFDSGYTACKSCLDYKSSRRYAIEAWKAREKSE
jgi:DNA-binding PadR family transcriptional regulator